MQCRVYLPQGPSAWLGYPLKHAYTSWSSTVAPNKERSCKKTNDTELNVCCVFKHVVKRPPSGNKTN